MRKENILILGGGLAGLTAAWNLAQDGYKVTILEKEYVVGGQSITIGKNGFSYDLGPHNVHSQRQHAEITAENYYPPQGIGVIADFFKENIIASGGEIKTNAQITSISVKEGYIMEVKYLQDETSHTVNTGDENSPWYVLSTLPINEIILMTDVPDVLKQEAKKLDFTSEVFLFLHVSKPEVFGVSHLYFSDPSFPFNRIYDVRCYSPSMTPENKTALCVEFTCSYGDELWNSSEDEIYEQCISSLEKEGLLHRKDIEGYATHRLKHAYPRFRVGYKESLKSLLDYVDTLDNFMTYGREGLFSYANVDDVIWMGMEVSKHVNYEDRYPLPIRELFQQYIEW